MSHLRTTILVSLLSLTTSFLGGYTFLEYLPKNPIDDYAVLKLPTEGLMKGVSLLCLGSSGNLKLSFDVGYAIGEKLKKFGIDAYVFSTLDTLDRSDPGPLHRISSSPYISAKVVDYFSKGLAAAGVVPVLDATNVDPRFVKVLVMEGLILPVFVEDDSQVDVLKKLGYESSVYKRDSGWEISLSWEGEREVDFESLRREVLRRSIVLLNPRGKGIAVNEPFSNAKVLVFSNEEWLLEMAKEVESGIKPSTGRKSW